MATSQSHIIHIHFFQPTNGTTDAYFGSLAAVYDYFTPEQIGAPLRRLWGKPIDNIPFATQRCTIARCTVFRKKQKRNNCLIKN